MNTERGLTKMGYESIIALACAFLLFAASYYLILARDDNKRIRERKEIEEYNAETFKRYWDARNNYGL